MQGPIPTERGSFRDPSGSVFEQRGVIFRSIRAPGVPDFEAAREAGVFAGLLEKGLLLPFEEVEPPAGAPPGTVHCLQHPRLPMVSYPWEWPFSLLKDAALLHLRAMEHLVPRGFWLRDASAFNVQHDGNKLRLIDTLSVGRRVPDSPWVAYGQFCGHFLAPLALAAHVDIRTLSMWRNYIDGYPLDLAAGMLPFVRRYQPGLFMHLTLHARMQRRADRKEDLRKRPEPVKAKVSDRGLIGLIRSLRRTVEGIRWESSSRIWEEYGDIRNYSPEDVTRKKIFVEQAVQELQPGVVWDLGGNTGEFSRIPAGHGAVVVSIDGDPACAETMYRNRKADGSAGGILPLTMDLGNPSPRLGWAEEERLSLSDRGPVDLVMALALVHHLVFSGCVPLQRVAMWLAKLGRFVLVEFVPPDDPLARKLAANRRGEHHPYDIDVFLKSFGGFFDMVTEAGLTNGRRLFLGRRKAEPG